MKPSFSVAMCTYNGARYVNDQLESIATQTQLPHELVVCDDASSDDTAKIVEKFVNRAPFSVRLYVNEVNLGSTKNFERAISLCNGEIIALCDQDDIWLPAKLERLGDEFAKSPAAGLVFSNADVIDERGRLFDWGLWEIIGLQPSELDRLRDGKACGDLLSGATVTGATAAFRTHFRDLVLPLPEDLPLIHDAWIALLIGSVANIVPVDERLVRYRSHGAQQVGPLERLSPPGGLRAVSEGEAQKALKRFNPYDVTLRVAQSVRQRLMEMQETKGFNSERALAELDSRITHLRARATMPESRLSRLPPVLRELLTWRYNLYSNGLYSALKDLFA